MNPAVPEQQTDLLESTDLATLAQEVATRIVETQGGVPTFFDNLVLWVRDAPASAPRAVLHRMRELLERQREGRFVAYCQRSRATADRRNTREIGALDFVASQGVGECLQWKGRPVFKTAFDFALYPALLWELRPATIIELGSGQGGSAVWMADLLRSMGAKGRVLSIDLVPPAVSDPDVTFIGGDIERIDALFATHDLAAAPHPWLVVEDAHVNLSGVLDAVHRAGAPGDYLVVEDSTAKQSLLGDFMNAHADSYRVDTRFTDMFGRNATCAADSIFLRIAP